MATAEQLKSLIRSHYGNDAERFYTVALQVAAHEAKQGHGALAHDIRGLIDQARKGLRSRMIEVPRELDGLVCTQSPGTAGASLVAGSELDQRIARIVLEFRQRNKLKTHGLEHRRKILLAGPPGTGKTMTAQVLARELGLPLHIIQMDRLVTRFMGETAAKLRKVFDMIREVPGIYFFDEFDAIGGERNRENDVGEMRRVLNAFLQFIEQDASDNLIIAATNNPKLLDHALFRRFDDVLFYKKPEKEERQRLIGNLLIPFAINSQG